MSFLGRTRVVLWVNWLDELAGAACFRLRGCSGSYCSFQPRHRCLRACLPSVVPSVAWRPSITPHRRTRSTGNKHTQRACRMESSKGLCGRLESLSFSRMLRPRLPDWFHLAWLRSFLDVHALRALVNFPLRTGSPGKHQHPHEVHHHYRFTITTDSTTTTSPLPLQLRLLQDQLHYRGQQQSGAWCTRACLSRMSRMSPAQLSRRGRINRRIRLS
jgi:hypothetical protein